MRRLFTFLLPLLLAGAALVGCDDSPTSVDDFDVQPAVTPSTAGLSFTKGQVPASAVSVRYQGLDAAPELVAPNGFAIGVASETGSPQSGSRTWDVTYEGDVPSLGSIQDVLVIRSVSGGQEIRDTVRVTVNSPVTVSDTYTNAFAVVEDFEGGQRAVTTSGGTAVEVVTDVVPPRSNGLSALRVAASGYGAVTFERVASAPDQTIFTLLLRPDPTTDFTLDVTFTELDNGTPQTHTVELPVAAGSAWRLYTIATQQVFDGFDPVAERAGGNGELQSVRLAADRAVTYHVDELAFGTNDGPTIEVNDFEATTNAYLCAPELRGPATSAVADLSDGPTGQTFTYVSGGNCFGYNFQSNGPALFLDAANDAALVLTIGEVSRAFNLFVFAETAGGAFSYGSGIEVPVQAGDSFREIRVPLADLGGDLSALRNPGLTNVGFEIRRPASDATSEPISFIVDGIKLLGR